MPILRLNKAFGVGRNAKVLLNLQVGLTRGAVRNLEHQERQAEKLRNVIRRQKKALERKDQQIKKERRRKQEQRITIWQQEMEISLLRNELNAINRLKENAHDVPSALQVLGKPKIGALPDFVVIGAMRCGTSQFYALLTQHPNVERAVVK